MNERDGCSWGEAIKPLRHFVPLCKKANKDAFCTGHPYPFLIYSVVRKGDLKPSSLSLHRPILEDQCKEAVGTPPEDWYVVFEVVPDEYGTGVTLGCSDRCGIMLNDASISSVHATLMRRGDGYYIEDEDSSAGTAVNGELLKPHETRKLRSGQRISLGNVNLVFHLPGAFFDFVRLVAVA